MQQAERAQRAQRVLIVTSRTGGGHASVAQALAAALVRLYPDRLQVAVVDPFDGARKSVVGRLLEFYAPIIVHWPGVWWCIYTLFDQRWFLRSVMAVGAWLLRGRAGRLLKETQPDVILSVHPLGHHLMAPALRRWPRRVPLVAVLTDLVSVHAAWATPPLDLYLAPTAEAERALVRAGMPPDRIRLVGLPIDPDFGRIDANAAIYRRRLGLDESRFTVLLVGGGEGAGGLEGAARAIAGSGLPVQLLVVCGRNRRLEHRLQRAGLGVPGRVWGFVNNMPELMGAADVVVSKAGSVSLAEAMAAGRPVLVIRAIPGQETENPAFLESRGAGRAVLDRERLVAVLASLYADPGARADMATSARAGARPEAARAAAEEVGCCLSLPRAAVPAVGRV